MTSQWPEDERTVETDPELIELPDSDPDLHDAELTAEEPLALTEEQLRGEGPPDDLPV
jgi:hypothetical protein